MLRHSHRTLTPNLVYDFLGLLLCSVSPLSLSSSSSPPNPRSCDPAGLSSHSAEPSTLLASLVLIHDVKQVAFLRLRRVPHLLPREGPSLGPGDGLPPRLGVLATFAASARFVRIIGYTKRDQGEENKLGLGLGLGPVAYPVTDHLASITRSARVRPLRYQSTIGDRHALTNIEERVAAHRYTNRCPPPEPRPSCPVRTQEQRTSRPMSQTSATHPSTAFHPRPRPHSPELATTTDDNICSVISHILPMRTCLYSLLVLSPSCSLRMPEGSCGQMEGRSQRSVVVSLGLDSCSLNSCLWSVCRNPSPAAPKVQVRAATRLSALLAA